MKLLFIEKVVTTRNLFPYFLVLFRSNFATILMINFTDELSVENFLIDRKELTSVGFVREARKFLSKVD